MQRLPIIILGGAVVNALRFELHETGEMAGNLAVQGAVPLQFNSYKIPLMRNLVKRAIAGGQEATWTSYSGQ